MALDELHERRLATLMNLFDDALDRIELVLRAAEERGAADDASPPTREEASEIRTAAEGIRRRLETAIMRFGLRRERPDWRQRIAAELSTLWVVLENAMPNRMKGYGRDFKPHDQLDWECLMRDLLRNIDKMRNTRPPKKLGL